MSSLINLRQTPTEPNSPFRAERTIRLYPANQVLPNSTSRSWFPIVSFPLFSHLRDVAVTFKLPQSARAPDGDWQWARWQINQLLKSHTGPKTLWGGFLVRNSLKLYLITSKLAQFVIILLIYLPQSQKNPLYCYSNYWKNLFENRNHIIILGIGR